MNETKPKLSYLPVTVREEEKLHDDLCLILKEIRPQWIKEEIKFKESPRTASYGVINTMVAAYVISLAQDGVMCRIYGEELRQYIAQKEEIDYIQLIGEFYNFAPHVVLKFKNGFCYDYIDGEILKPETIHVDPIWRIVAKQTAQLHSLPIPKELQVRSKLYEFFFGENKRYPEKMSDEKLNARFQKEFPSRQTLLKEHKEIVDIIKSLDIPLVLIHGDLRPENMIWNSKTGQVTFVDFECTSYDYQTIDIAYHFFRFAGINDVDYSLFPSENFQREWIAVYLQELFFRVGQTETEINEKLIETLRVKVLKTYLLFLLTSAASGPATRETPLEKELPFDIFEFASRSYKEYQRVKDDILALSLPQ